MSKEKWGLIDKHSDWEFGDWVEALVEMTKHRDAWRELCGRWVEWPKLVREWERACSRYSDRITDDEPGDYPQPPPEKPEGV